VTAATAIAASLVNFMSFLPLGLTLLSSGFPVAIEACP